MQHEQVLEHLEEYVLGTLASDERLAVEEHLDAGCDVCLKRVAELSEVTAGLSDMLPPKQPAPELRQRIQQSLRARATSDSHVAEAPESSANRRSGTPSFISLLAAAAAVVLVVWIWNLKSQIDDLTAQLQSAEQKAVELHEKIAAYEDATALLAEPGMQFIDLAGVAPNEQAFGKVVIDPDRGTGVVYMYSLPPTPEGMAYQLWVVREGVPTSVGTFTVNDDGTAMLTLETMPDLGSIASFDVTIEPAGGMPAPTGMMYLTSPSVIQSP